jgi:hypothetical protein
MVPSYHIMRKIVSDFFSKNYEFEIFIFLFKFPKTLLQEQTCGFRKITGKEPEFL